MSKFRKFFRNRDFVLLWMGQIISQIGDRLDQMALIALVYSRAQGSTMGIAKILSFTIIPVFLIGPVAGAYVDRWDKRRIMYICDFLRAALVFLIPFLLINKSFIWIYPVIFIVFSIGRFFVPAKLAIIPELVDKKDYVMANSLVNTTGMIAAVVGLGAGGIIVEWVKAKGGFYLDALSFFISGALIFFISKKFAASVDFMEVGREIVEAIRKSLFQEIKEGIWYFFRQKNIRLTAAVIFLLWSALGAAYVVVIVFVQDALGSTTKHLGLLAMFLGIGLFCGSIVFGRFGQRVSLYKTIFSSLALSGLMLFIFALAIHRWPYFFVAAGLAFLLGICVAPIMIATNTIIHNVSENNMMGKIFSSLEIVIHLGFLIFMFLSSWLAERIAPVNILVFVGVIIMLAGFASLFLNHKISWLR